MRKARLEPWKVSAIFNITVVFLLTSINKVLVLRINWLANLKCSVISSYTENPPQDEPSSSRYSDGSSSGSAPSSPQEKILVSPLQEYILNLTEE